MVQKIRFKSQFHLFGEFWGCNSSPGYFIPSEVPFMNAQSWSVLLTAIWDVFVFLSFPLPDLTKHIFITLWIEILPIDHLYTSWHLRNLTHWIYQNWVREGCRKKNRIFYSLLLGKRRSISKNKKIKFCN